MMRESVTVSASVWRITITIRPTTKPAVDANEQTATPITKPRTFAPESPSIARSRASKARMAAAAPRLVASSNPASEAGSWTAPSRAMAASRRSFRARPGRTSNRFQRLALPARTGTQSHVGGDPGPVIEKATRHEAATIRVSLTTPDVSCPANARRI